MARRQRVKLDKTRTGDVKITFEMATFEKVIDLKPLSKEAKLNAIRWAILVEGYVFDEKTEKVARRMLGL